MGSNPASSKASTEWMSTLKPMRLTLFHILSDSLNDHYFSDMGFDLGLRIPCSDRLLARPLTLLPSTDHPLTFHVNCEPWLLGNVQCSFSLLGMLDHRSSF
jgi:hypothetical protein